MPEFIRIVCVSYLWKHSVPGTLQTRSHTPTLFRNTAFGQIRTRKGRPSWSVSLPKARLLGATRLKSAFRCSVSQEPQGCDQLKPQWREEEKRAWEIINLFYSREFKCLQRSHVMGIPVVGLFHTNCGMRASPNHRTASKYPKTSFCRTRCQRFFFKINFWTAHFRKAGKRKHKSSFLVCFLKL